MKQERPSQGPSASKPWLWLGLGVAGVLGFVWSARPSAVVDKADDWQGAGPAPAPEPQVEAPVSAPIELSLHVYDSHLAHVRFTPDGAGILAFGSEGATLRSNDDGKTWRAVEVPTRQFLSASVADRGSGSIVVVGTRGTILRSDDQGQTFVTVLVDTKGSFRAISMSASGSEILAVGDGGMAYVSRDGGRSFASEATSRTDYLSQVIALPKRARFVVTGDDGTLLLRDEGGGWRAITTVLTTKKAGLFQALSVLPNGAVLAATQSGSVLRSDDDGETWHEIYKTGTDSFVAGFEIDDAGSLVAARMRRGDLLLSSNGGTTFESTSLGIKPGVARLAWVPSHGFVGIAGDNSALRSDQTGKRWSNEPSPLRNGALDIAVRPGTGSVIVVGRSGLVARSTDRGKHYQIIRPGLGGSLRAFADGSAAGCLVAVGMGATVVHSLDAGQSWQRVPLGIGPQIELTSVVAEPKSRALLAGGGSGTLLRSSDCGRSWAAVGGASSDVSSLSVGESSTILALTAKSPALRSTDAGRSFVPADMEADASLKRAVALSPSEWVAVGDGGRVYRSSDDGKSFQRVASGTDANLRALAYDAARHTLWAVGDGGAVLRSTDQGVTWVRIAVPTTENLFVVGLHPTGDAVWLGGNRGITLRSSDHGEHFAIVVSGSTQTIRVIAFDPVSKEFVIAGAGGTLLRTVDGARLATVVSTFDGRIDAALFHAPSGAMFLGGERLARLGD
jgi:photosystem II stability/assembly factor-like uncharacterized protein